MAAAGVLIHGYGSEEAMRIRLFLDGIAGSPVFMASASGKNGERIIDILENTVVNSFTDDTPKVLMLVGFSEEQIGEILAKFPAGAAGMPRPIFCTLTEHNRNWPLAQLLEHLEEERRYWSARKSD